VGKLSFHAHAPGTPSESSSALFTSKAKVSGFKRNTARVRPRFSAPSFPSSCGAKRRRFGQFLKDKELRDEYEGALSKREVFPVAFSLKGLGDSHGAAHDSLMRIFEEQIAEAVAQHRPDLVDKIRITSADSRSLGSIKKRNYQHKAGVEAYLKDKFQLSAADYRAKHGDRKLGQAVVGPVSS